MTLESQILDFIQDELLDEVDDLDAGDNLLADGMVDSLGMMRLTAFIEEAFDITVPPEDFIIEHFRTVESLERYLVNRGVGQAQ